MCQWGTYEHVEVTVPARLSHTGEDRKAVKSIDACIAPLVKALNDAGVSTIASCCGHGNRNGSIILGDGREIIIARDYDEARAMERAIPTDIHGEDRVATLEREARKVIDLLREVGDETGWRDKDETDRVYAWYEFDDLRAALGEGETAPVPTGYPEK